MITLISHLFHIYFIGVRVYPYGIFDPWAQWDWAWMGLENSSAVVVAAAVAPLENH